VSDLSSFDGVDDTEGKEEENGKCGQDNFSLVGETVGADGDEEDKSDDGEESSSNNGEDHPGSVLSFGVVLVAENVSSLSISASGSSQLVLGVLDSGSIRVEVGDDVLADDVVGYYLISNNWSSSWEDGISDKSNWRSSDQVVGCYDSRLNYSGFNQYSVGRLHD